MNPHLLFSQAAILFSVVTCSPPFFFLPLHGAASKSRTHVNGWRCSDSMRRNCSVPFLPPLFPFFFLCSPQLPLFVPPEGLTPKSPMSETPPSSPPQYHCPKQMAPLAALANCVFLFFTDIIVPLSPTRLSWPWAPLLYSFQGCNLSCLINRFVFPLAPRPPFFSLQPSIFC